MPDLESLHASSQRLTAAALSLGKLAYDLAEQAARMRDALSDLLEAELTDTVEYRE